MVTVGDNWLDGVIHRERLKSNKHVESTEQCCDGC